MRTITLLVVLSFILPYLTWAFEPEVFKPIGPVLLFKGRPLAIPPKLGVTEESFQGQAPCVILIQDLHCNYEVQKNIAGILEKLSQQAGLRLVGVEGASEAIHTDKLATFPVPRVREMVTDLFLKQGKISGSEYFAVKAGSKLALEGVERAELYAAQRASIPSFFRDEAQGLCLDLREGMEAIKVRVFQPGLKAVDAKRSAFREGNLGVLQYAGFLLNTAREQNLPLTPYVSLERWVTDPGRPLAEALDAETFFRELEQLDQAIRQRLFSSPAEIEVDAANQQLDLMERVLSLSATPDDLTVFRTQAMSGSMHQLADLFARYGQGLEEGSWQQFETYLQAAANFYRLADDRSPWFITNLLAKMRSGHEQVGVLVTGGYHTAALAADLKRRGISYLRVRPRLTQWDWVNPYFTLLKGRATSLEQVLSQHQNIFQLPTWFPTQAQIDLSDERSLPLRVRLFLNQLELGLESALTIELAREGFATGELWTRLKAGLQTWPANTPVGLLMAMKVGNALVLPARLADQGQSLTLVWQNSQTAWRAEGLQPLEQWALGDGRVSLFNDIAPQRLVAAVQSLIRPGWWDAMVAWGSQRPSAFKALSLRALMVARKNIATVVTSQKNIRDANPNSFAFWVARLLWPQDIARQMKWSQRGLVLEIPALIMLGMLGHPLLVLVGIAAFAVLHQMARQHLLPTLEKGELLGGVILQLIFFSPYLIAPTLLLLVSLSWWLIPVLVLASFGAAWIHLRYDRAQVERYARAAIGSAIDASDGWQRLLAGVGSRHEALARVVVQGMQIRLQRHPQLGMVERKGIIDRLLEAREMAAFMHSNRLWMDLNRLLDTLGAGHTPNLYPFEQQRSVIDRLLPQLIFPWQRWLLRSGILARNQDHGGPDSVARLAEIARSGGWWLARSALRRMQRLYQEYPEMDRGIAQTFVGQLRAIYPRWIYGLVLARRAEGLLSQSNFPGSAPRSSRPHEQAAAKILSEQLPVFAGALASGKLTMVQPQVELVLQAARELGLLPQVRPLLQAYLKGSPRLQPTEINRRLLPLGYVIRVDTPAPQIFRVVGEEQGPAVEGLPLRLLHAQLLGPEQYPILGDRGFNLPGMNISVLVENDCLAEGRHLLRVAQNGGEFLVPDRATTAGRPIWLELKQTLPAALEMSNRLLQRVFSAMNEDDLLPFYRRLLRSHEWRHALDQWCQASTRIKLNGYFHEFDTYASEFIELPGDEALFALVEMHYLSKQIPDTGLFLLALYDQHTQGHWTPRPEFTPQEVDEAYVQLAALAQASSTDLKQLQSEAEKITGDVLGEAYRGRGYGHLLPGQPNRPGSHPKVQTPLGGNPASLAFWLARLLFPRDLPRQWRWGQRGLTLEIPALLGLGLWLGPLPFAGFLLGFIVAHAGLRAWDAGRRSLLGRTWPQVLMGILVQFTFLSPYLSVPILMSAMTNSAWLIPLLVLAALVAVNLHALYDRGQFTLAVDEDLYRASFGVRANWPWLVDSLRTLDEDTTMKVLQTMQQGYRQDPSLGNLERRRILERLLEMSLIWSYLDRPRVVESLESLFHELRGGQADVGMQAHEQFDWLFRSMRLLPLIGGVLAKIMSWMVLLTVENQVELQAGQIVARMIRGTGRVSPFFALFALQRMLDREVPFPRTAMLHALDRLSQRWVWTPFTSWIDRLRTRVDQLPDRLSAGAEWSVGVDLSSREDAQQVKRLTETLFPRLTHALLTAQPNEIQRWSEAVVRQARVCGLEEEFRRLLLDPRLGLSHRLFQRINDRFLQFGYYLQPGEGYPVFRIDRVERLDEIEGMPMWFFEVRYPGQVEDLLKLGIGGFHTPEYEIGIGLMDEVEASAKRIHRNLQRRLPLVDKGRTNDPAAWIALPPSTSVRTVQLAERLLQHCLAGRSIVYVVRMLINEIRLHERRHQIDRLLFMSYHVALGGYFQEFATYASSFIEMPTRDAPLALVRLYSEAQAYPDVALFLLALHDQWRSGGFIPRKEYTWSEVEVAFADLAEFALRGTTEVGELQKLSAEVVGEVLRPTYTKEGYAHLLPKAWGTPAPGGPEPGNPSAGLQNAKPNSLAFWIAACLYPGDVVRQIRWGQRGLALEIPALVALGLVVGPLILLATLAGFVALHQVLKLIAAYRARSGINDLGLYLGGFLDQLAAMSPYLAISLMALVVSSQLWFLPLELLVIFVVVRFHEKYDRIQFKYYFQRQLQTGIQLKRQGWPLLLKAAETQDPESMRQVILAMRQGFSSDPNLGILERRRIDERLLELEFDWRGKQQSEILNGLSLMRQIIRGPWDPPSPTGYDMLKLFWERIKPWWMFWLPFNRVLRQWLLSRTVDLVGAEAGSALLELARTSPPWLGAQIVIAASGMVGQDISMPQTALLQEVRRLRSSWWAWPWWNRLDGAERVFQQPAPGYTLGAGWAVPRAAAPQAKAARSLMEELLPRFATEIAPEEAAAFVLEQQIKRQATELGIWPELQQLMAFGKEGVARGTLRRMNRVLTRYGYYLMAGPAPRSQVNKPWLYALRIDGAEPTLEIDGRPLFFFDLKLMGRERYPAGIPRGFHGPDFNQTFGLADTYGEMAERVDLARLRNLPLASPLDAPDSPGLILFSFPNLRPKRSYDLTNQLLYRSIQGKDRSAIGAMLRRDILLHERRHQLDELFHAPIKQRVGGYYTEFTSYASAFVELEGADAYNTLAHIYCTTAVYPETGLLLLALYDQWKTGQWQPRQEFTIDELDAAYQEMAEYALQDLSHLRELQGPMQTILADVLGETYRQRGHAELLPRTPGSGKRSLDQASAVVPDGGTGGTERPQGVGPALRNDLQPGTRFLKPLLPLPRSLRYLWVQYWSWRFARTPLSSDVPTPRAWDENALNQRLQPLVQQFFPTQGIELLGQTDPRPIHLAVLADQDQREVAGLYREGDQPSISLPAGLLQTLAQGHWWETHKVSDSVQQAAAARYRIAERYFQNCLAYHRGAYERTALLQGLGETLGLDADSQVLARATAEPRPVQAPGNLMNEDYRDAQGELSVGPQELLHLFAAYWREASTLLGPGATEDLMPSSAQLRETLGSQPFWAGRPGSETLLRALESAPNTVLGLWLHEFKGTSAETAAAAGAMEVALEQAALEREPRAGLVAAHRGVQPPGQVTRLVTLAAPASAGQMRDLIQQVLPRLRGQPQAAGLIDRLLRLEAALAIMEQAQPGVPLAWEGAVSQMLASEMGHYRAQQAPLAIELGQEFGRQVFLLRQSGSQRFHWSMGTQQMDFSAPRLAVVETLVQDARSLERQLGQPQLEQGSLLTPFQGRPDQVPALDLGLGFSLGYQLLFWMAGLLPGQWRVGLHQYLQRQDPGAYFRVAWAQLSQPAQASALGQQFQSPGWLLENYLRMARVPGREAGAQVRAQGEFARSMLRFIQHDRASHPQDEARLAQNLSCLSQVLAALPSVPSAVIATPLPGSRLEPMRAPVVLMGRGYRGPLGALLEMLHPLPLQIRDDVLQPYLRRGFRLSAAGSA